MAAISQEQWDHIVATMQGTQQVLEQQRAYMEGLEQRVAEAQDVANQANARAPEPAPRGGHDDFWMEKVLKTMLNNKFTEGKTLFSEWAAQFISIVSMYRSTYKQVLHDAQHSPTVINQDDFPANETQANK